MNFQNLKKNNIHKKVTDLPDGTDPYLRENYQRNCISRGLKNANPEDIVIISDLDEIPDPKKIKFFKKRDEIRSF